MAFRPQYLRIIACAGNFTLWHYHSEDSHDEILSNDYFKEACCLRSGDVLIIENKINEEETVIKLYALSHKKTISTMS